MKFTNKNSTKSTNSKYTLKTNKLKLKSSLSINNFNIYRYSNQGLNSFQNNYAIENTLSDLLIKRMSGISMESPLKNKKNNIKPERKVNFINVNNYFNPQINIIKVNKLNEKVLNNKNSTKEYGNKLIKKYNFPQIKKSNEPTILSKIKLIQLWWKDINKIIIIQKNIRGYMYRNKLLEILEQEERIISNVFYLYKIVRKIFGNYLIKKLKFFITNLKKYSYIPSKGNLIRKKLFKGVKEKSNQNYKNQNKDKFNIRRNKINNNNNNKIITNNLSFHPKYFANSKEKNIPESTSFIGFISNKNNSIKNVNKNKKTIEVIPKLKNFSKNNLLMNKNKSILMNDISNISNVKPNNNIEFLEFSKYNKNIKNIINLDKNKNKVNNNKKSILKSRNQESNKSYLSSNNFKNLNKNHHNILVENNKHPFLTIKSINKKISFNYKSDIIQTVKSNKVPKKAFSFINNNNNDFLNDKSKTSKNKKFSIFKFFNKNNLVKKEEMKEIRQYFLFWKELTEKKIILKYIIKNNCDNASNFSFTLKPKIIDNNKFHLLRNDLFKRGLGLLLKKILDKCTLYKYFLLFNHYTERIKILKKLLIYMKHKSRFKSDANVISRIGGKIPNSGWEEKNKLSVEIPKRMRYKKKRISAEKIGENKLSLSSSFLTLNKKKLSNINNDSNYNNLNYSIQNLPMHQKIKINRHIYNSLFKSENSKKKKKDIINPSLVSLDSNLIVQTNQLKMIFNLIELHNKRKNSIKYYFENWKKKINDNYILDYNNQRIRFLPPYTFNKFTYRHRNFTSRHKYFSPLKRKNRTYGYKNKLIYSKNKSDFTGYVKFNLINTNFNSNDYNNYNMVYKKKLFFAGNRTSRNNISDYSSIFDNKKTINYENNNFQNSYTINTIHNSRFHINYNIGNPINQTLDNTSLGKRFLKKINKIEEKEIFFNKEKKVNNEYNIKTYKNNNKANKEFAINYYYRNIPKKRNFSPEFFHFRRATTVMDNSGKELIIRTKNERNKSFEMNKKEYFYSFFSRILMNRNKTV